MPYTRYDISSKDAAAIIRAAFPDYRKKSASIVVTDSVTFQDVNWSGGTKSEYRAVSLATMRCSAPSMDRAAPWENPFEGKKVDLVPGYVIVRGGFFCGKPSTISIYAHPDDVAKLLPAPVGSRLDVEA